MIDRFENTQEAADSGRDDFMKELERLIACYQIASRDDRNVVWAALNKYMPHVTAL